jgi:tRNA1Val (adenine37-N6)-methyltransferase
MLGGLVRSDAGFFRGWARPGPVPPGAARNSAVAPGETLDAISGHFRLFQLQDGHRFSTDDLLTAWYGTTWCPSAHRVLDLGSGIGSVATIAAWRLPGASLVTVEAQAASVALARRSAVYNGLSARCDIREGDFRDHGVLEEHERFDLVLGSPPYFPVGSGVEGDHPQKIACRFELRGDIRDYCRVAAAHLAPGGFFACVFPMAEEHRRRLEQGRRDAGLSLIRERPVALREGDAPLIGLFGLMRAGDLPDNLRERTWSEPPLVIRRADGRVHPEYAVLKLAIGFPP